MDEDKCYSFRKTGKPGLTWLTGRYIATRLETASDYSPVSVVTLPQTEEDYDEKMKERVKQKLKRQKLAEKSDEKTVESQEPDRG